MFYFLSANAIISHLWCLRGRGGTSEIMMLCTVLVFFVFQLSDKLITTHNFVNFVAESSNIFQSWIWRVFEIDSKNSADRINKHICSKWNHYPKLEFDCSKQISYIYLQEVNLQIHLYPLRRLRPHNEGKFPRQDVHTRRFQAASSRFDNSPNFVEAFFDQNLNWPKSLL